MSRPFALSFQDANKQAVLLCCVHAVCCCALRTLLYCMCLSTCAVLCCAVVPCVRLFCAVLYVSDAGVVMAVLGEMLRCYNSCGIYGVKHAFIGHQSLADFI